MHKLDHNRTVRSRLVGIIASTFAAMLLVASPNVAHAKNTPKVAKAPPGAKKHGRPPGVAAAGKARAKKPTWKERNAAKKAYKAGVAAMKKKDFVAAVEHFKSSFKQVESPNSKFMLARALTAEGKYVAAYTAISETVTLAEEAVKKNAAKYKKTLDAAKAEQAKLRLSLIHI